MGVKAFTFDASLTDAFLRLGDDLYRGDPRWIPPDAAALRWQLGPSFPFHGHAGHDHRRFLALLGGRPVARALASIHPGLRDADGTPVGAIGFFESAPDYPAAADVLGAAADWLRARGCRRVWAPVNFDIWHGYRLMTRGYDEDRFPGEPCNKPYYVGFFDRFGLRPLQAWNSFPVPAGDGLRSLGAPGADAFRDLVAAGYRFEPFDAYGRERALSTLHEALVASFAGFPGFTPLAREEFVTLASRMAAAVETRCSTFVRDDEGRLAAFVVAFRDAAARRRRLLLHLAGVLPDAARRRRGLARAVFHHTAAQVRASGYQDVLATVVARGNPIRRHWGRHAEDDRREYTLFAAGA
jgi:hypothetical protein